MSLRRAFLLVFVCSPLLTALDAGAALTVSVEMGPDRVRPSEPLNALITVNNNGAAAVAGVALQAAVPAGISAISPALISGGVNCPPTVSNNGACDPTEVMNWTLGTIPAGASVTTSIAMFVASATTAGTSITLTASVQSGAISGSATVTVSADNALMLAVDDDADPVPAGATLTYTLTYGNRSTISVDGVALSFPIPAGTTFVSATGGGTLGGGNVQWNLGTLPASQSGQQQVKVAVGAGLGAGSVLAVNAAVLTGTSTVAETARAMAVTSVSNPILGLALEMNPDPVRPSEWTIAELTITNRSAATVFGVALQARMPQGINAISTALSNKSVSCPAGVANNGACDGNELGNWSLGAIPAGEAITVSLPIPVNAATPGGRLLSLEALVKGDNVHETNARETVAVDGDEPLMLAVDENLDPVPAGGSLTYTLTYSNRSTIAANSTVLSFPIPAGTTFVSATGGGILSGGNVQWTLGTLPATQTDQQQVVVAVGAGLTAGSYLEVDAAQLSGTTLSGAEITRATATTVVGNPLLGLAVQVNPDPVRTSESALLEFTVTNRTANPIFNIVLQARMPQGIDPVSPLLVTKTVTCPAGISNNGACDAVELGNWTIGTLPAGAASKVSMPLPIDASTAAGRLLNVEALVVDDGTHQALMKQTVGIDGDAPLTLAVDEDADPVRAGGLLTYVLTYANRSTTAITGTTLSFPIPAGATFISATNGGVLSGGKVQWSIGNLPATQSDQQQVVVAVDGGLVGGSILLVDDAQLSGLGVLSESARSTAVTSVTSSPTLGLAVEVSPDPVRPGEWGNAKLTVTNRTTDTLFNVVLQGRMPQGINAISPAVISGGTASCAAGISNNGACDGLEIGTWAMGSLAGGASASFLVPLPIDASAAAGRLINLEALVSDDSSHQSSFNQTVAIDSDNPLTLAVDEDVDPIPAGGMLTYSLTYGNRSSTAITGATLSLPVPGLGGVAGSTGGVISNGRFVWNLGTLAPGTGGRRKLFLTVPGGVPAGSLVLANEAVVRGTGVLPESARGNAATAVSGSKPLSLSTSLERDPTQPGAALTGTLNVTNNSGAALSTVVLDARVPLPVTSFSPTLLGMGGTCVVGIANNGACDSVEIARWTFASIAAGATVSVSMPMTVASTGTGNGRTMILDARVSDSVGDNASETRTALVTPFVDGDSDTVADIYDNCPFFANTSQADVDLDGRGNACECTDQNGDGRNTVADIVAINTAIFNPGLVTPLCDGNNDGKCDVNDIIAANIEIFSPTNTSTCARSPVAGP